MPTSENNQNLLPNSEEIGEKLKLLGEMYF